VRDSSSLLPIGVQAQQWLVLVAIVMLAAVPRLWGLGGQPVVYFDSGVYLGEGAFLASAAQRAAAALVTPGPPGSLERVAQATEQGTDAHPPDIAKPGHAVLLGAAILLLGQTALAGALVSALTGIGTVVVTYAIGLHGWGQRVALAAAVLLALSGQHLVYSREPLVESDGMLFAALGALVYLRSKSLRGLALAGVLYGVAFTCNNRLSYLPLVFLIAELAEWAGWRTLVRRGIVFGAGFVAPLAAIELAYVAARAVGRAAQVRTDWLDYVQQLATFSRMNPPDRLRFDQWPTYFVDVALMDGLVVLALLLVGLVVAVARIKDRPWRRADLLLLGSLVIPLALYSVYSTGEVRMRHFSLALPWVALTAAIGLERLTAFFGAWRTTALSVALVGLIVLALPRTIALATPPDGMPSVLAYLNGVGESRVASTNGPALGFELGEDRTNARLREAFVNTPADLSALAASYPLLVVDMQAYVFPGQLTARYDQVRPELSVPHANDAWYLADLLEHYGVAWGGWDQLLSMWRTNRDAASQLRVYATRELQP
jgi:Dolichyl-phosphate-mannose-protein mannosyltransferase